MSVVKFSQGVGLTVAKKLPKLVGIKMKLNCFDFKSSEVTHQVAEVTGTLGHVSGASLASGRSVDDALTRVHETTNLGAAALHRLGKADATVGRHRHPADLLRAEDAKLDPLDLPDRRLRVPGVNGRHVWIEASTAASSAREWRQL